MKLSIQAGATSQSINVFIQDSASLTGAGLTGLVYNSASLVAYYALPRAAAVSVTLATLAAVTSGFSSGGFKEISSTNMPGWYRLDLPDAALAAGAGRFVCFHLQGAAGMAPLPIEIELTGWNNQDAVRGGMTALPNAAAEAAGGLYTRGSGAGQIAQDANGRVNTNAVALAAQAITAAAGVTFPSSVASPTNITAGTITTVASVTGAVGSVTGAVGSVTGLTASDVGAIKAKTDSLTFTVSGKLDANLTHVIADPIKVSSSKTTAWGGT